MAFACKYESVTEEHIHHDAIHRLAEELNEPEEKVQVVYEEFLSGLQQEAKIKNFLGILVIRQVKDTIRSRSLTTKLMEFHR